MYPIRQYHRKQAEKLRVLIKPSSKGVYKLDIFSRNGDYLTSIGDNRYGDYVQFIEEYGMDYANHRRALYWNRHKKENIKGTRGYYALHILW